MKRPPVDIGRRRSARVKVAIDVAPPKMRGMVVADTIPERIRCDCDATTTVVQHGSLPLPFRYPYSCVRRVAAFRRARYGRDAQRPRPPDGMNHDNPILGTMGEVLRHDRRLARRGIGSRESVSVRGTCRGRFLSNGGDEPLRTIRSASGAASLGSRSMKARSARACRRQNTGRIESTFSSPTQDHRALSDHPSREGGSPSAAASRPWPKR